MEQLLMQINQLANKSKKEGLSSAEKERQVELRQMYLSLFRGSLDDILLNTTVYDSTGADVTPVALKNKQTKPTIQVIKMEQWEDEIK
ncbi:hypothetical protein CKN82_06520 [Carnobacterium divergens]|uniref:DUF896 domain-containing protein n=1 Tax=Carnobacterium divergens TaxID=2748 RepID=UPI0010723DF0|nr:DUF896 domain-containing protein [Carnobacterium divergens]MDT1997340.1 DUF896 domain-containing protein [Carnobacterium divergens]MDT2012720.1 DUF896 domain-containing protein [Carnobacterium divergens]TFI65584.1 hypothetical protein CKN76_06775 [Carnobacterium divergens]TFI65647.1 hypothetical protein CKN59_06760 [Carnobacterium divergens]TFI69282.1 hypothetical protein CKN70_06570 [Carnobacterium divergens]